MSRARHAAPSVETAEPPFAPTGERRRALLALTLGSLATLSGGLLLASSGALITGAALRPETLLVLMPLITGVRFFGLSRAALRYVERLVAHDLTLRRLTRLRAHLLAQLEPLAPAILRGRSGGELLNVVRADVDALQGAFLRLVAPTVTALVVSIVALGATWFLSPTLTLVLAVVLSLAGLVLPLAAVRAAVAPGRRLVHERAVLRGAVLDATRGLADLLTLGGQAGVEASLDVRLAGIERLERRLARTTAALTVAREVLGGFGLLAGLWLIGDVVARGDAPVAMLAAASLGLLAAFEAVGSLGPAWATLGTLREARERVAALGATVPLVSDPERPTPLPTDATLRWEHVTVTYEGRQRAALSGFSLTVGPGDRVALVGSSGSGKSTALDLALRVRDPMAGRVTLGGVDLRDLRLTDVRTTFGWAPQRAELFDGTLRENLLIADPEATDEHLLAVLNDVGLDGLIERLPAGLDHWIGEFGTRLSAGERARLSLARALLRPGRVLLLDEPTAHLDTTLGRELLTVVSGRAGQRGVLVVTHTPELLDGRWRVVPMP